MITKAIPNPEKLNRPSEIADVIRQIDEFERMHHEPAVVVKRQNLSLGVSYDILSLYNVQREIGKWHGPECYLKFWERPYFIQLQEQLR